jgi:hypothetical protein
MLVKKLLHSATAVALSFLCSCAATVTPPLPRDVRIDPDPVNFREVFVGDTENRPAVITNNTAAPLNVASSSIQAGTPFSPGVVLSPLPATVPTGGGIAAFRFDFKPVDLGDFTAKWTVNINGTNYTLDLRGKGVGVEKKIQELGFNPRDAWVSETNGIDFGPVTVGQRKKARLDLVKSGQNLGVRIPPVITETPGNPQAGAFRLVKPTAPPTTLTLVEFTIHPLAPNERVTIGTEVEFKPPAAGTYKATLTISDSIGLTVMRIFLKGVGVASATPSPTPGVAPSPTPGD